MKTLKTIVISLMVLQVILFAVGVTQLYLGEMFWGIFNTSLNVIFFLVNRDTLKNIKETEKLQKDTEEYYAKLATDLKPNWVTFSKEKEDSVSKL